VLVKDRRIEELAEALTSLVTCVRIILAVIRMEEFDGVQESVAVYKMERQARMAMTTFGCCAVVLFYGDTKLKLYGCF
jgi:hypothetical protein